MAIFNSYVKLPEGICNKSYPLVIQHSYGQLGPFGSFSSMIYPWKIGYCPQRQTNRRYIPIPSSSQPTNSPLPRPFLRNSHENNATRTILEEVDWMRFLSCRQWNIRRYGGILSHGGSPNHHGYFNTKSWSWMIFFGGYPVLGHLHMIFTDIWWSRLDEHPRNRNEQSLRY